MDALSFYARRAGPDGGRRAVRGVGRWNGGGPAHGAAGPRRTKGPLLARARGAAPECRSYFSFTGPNPTMSSIPPVRCAFGLKIACTGIPRATWSIVIPVR